MTTSTARKRPAAKAAATAPRAAATPAAPVFYRPDNYKPDDSVGYLMRRIMSHVSLAIDAEFESDGLTHAQWMPLIKLYMGHASTVAELARACELDTGGMTRMLDRLEDKGLVRRVRSVEDRRVVNVELTGEGRATAQRIPIALCSVQNAHLRGFTLEEWAVLKTLLRRVLDNAQALQAEREQGKK